MAIASPLVPEPHGPIFVLSQTLQLIGLHYCNILDSFSAKIYKQTSQHSLQLGSLQIILRESEPELRDDGLAIADRLFITPNHRGMARLSWPGWLLRRHSPLKSTVEKSSKNVEMGSFGLPILGAGTPRVLDMHFQIWLTFQRVAKFGKFHSVHELRSSWRNKKTIEDKKWPGYSISIWLRTKIALYKCSCFPFLSHYVGRPNDIRKSALSKRNNLCYAWNDFL